MFASNNAGKYAINIDLTDSAQRERLYRLVAEADIIVENFRVGVTTKLGVDFDTLSRINPDIVYLSLSSQGQDGPESRYRSYGSTLDLLSGLASVTGYPGGGPVWSGADVNFADQVVSVAGAALAAYCVLRQVRGAFLDVAQREMMTWTLGDLVDQYLDSGRIAHPTGNCRPGLEPRDVYPCKERNSWIAIVGTNDAEREALARLIGLDLSSDLATWQQNDSLTRCQISAWTSSHTLRTVAQALADAGVPATPVVTASQRADDTHFLERRVFLAGPPRCKGYPLVLHSYTPPDPSPAPALGEHDCLIGEGVWPSSPANSAATASSLAVGAQPPKSPLSPERSLR
jgi:crotonobetainyl-CoA:carnitine CoA-transferase CaiB-like acyl-CoA transferase